jgi:hypothetical protein
MRTVVRILISDLAPLTLFGLAGSALAAAIVHFTSAAT